MKTWIWVGALCVGVAGAGYWMMTGHVTGTTQADGTAGAPLVEVSLPDSFTSNAQSGKRVYETNCATCHGENAVGQEGVAPPLVHKIYEPSHHGDESFQRAVALGVRAHHWPFGDMPPVERLTRADVAMIVAYVRELQVANGIN